MGRDERLAEGQATVVRWHEVVHERTQPCGTQARPGLTHQQRVLEDPAGAHHRGRSTVGPQSRGDLHRRVDHRTVESSRDRRARHAGAQLAAVGGAVDNGLPESAVAWTGLLIEFNEDRQRLGASAREKRSGYR